MLKANEINPNVSEQDSAGSEHDEENNHQNPEGVKILKGLTMEVFRFILMIKCPFIIVWSEFFVKQRFHLKVSFEFFRYEVNSNLSN